MDAIVTHCPIQPFEPGFAKAAVNNMAEFCWIHFPLLIRQFEVGEFGSQDSFAVLEEHTANYQTMEFVEWEL